MKRNIPILIPSALVMLCAVISARSARAQPCQNLEGFEAQFVEHAILANNITYDRQDRVPSTAFPPLPGYTRQWIAGRPGGQTVVDVWRLERSGYVALMFAYRGSALNQLAAQILVPFTVPVVPPDRPNAPAHNYSWYPWFNMLSERALVNTQLSLATLEQAGERSAGRPRTWRVIFTGQSLGGVTAALASVNWSNYGAARNIPITTLSFNPPKMGSAEANRDYANLQRPGVPRGFKAYQLQRAGDVVKYWPPTAAAYTQRNLMWDRVARGWSFDNHVDSSWFQLPAVLDSQATWTMRNEVYQYLRSNAAEAQELRRAFLLPTSVGCVLGNDP
jgi:hypothetical protein